MKFLLAFCLYSGLVITAHGQNWPSFRGPNASGVSNGPPPPTTWDTEKSSNISWKTPIPGLAHSSPVVWGDRIFLTTAMSSDPNSTFQAKDRGIGLARDEVKHTWRIYCLDKHTGKVLWDRMAYEGVPRAKRHVKASQANSTPVTDGKYVVALMGSEGLFAYDLNGKLLWKQDLGVLNPGLANDPSSEWGHSSSPVIYKHLVIVQCDGHKQSFIAAYNLKDGKRAWRMERSEITSWSTPTIYQSRHRTELISNGGHYIRGYDPLTGRELWRFADENTEVKMQAPLVAHDLIFITGGFPPGRAMYAFHPGATGDISSIAGQAKNPFIAWHSSKGSPYTPTPIIYGDYLYTCADNGVFTAYNAKTGDRIYQTRLPSSFSASPVAAGGKLYLSSEDGDVYVVQAGAKFELLAVNKIGEALMATPAISEGVIIVRSQHYLFGIAEKGGARRASNHSGSGAAP